MFKTSVVSSIYSVVYVVVVQSSRRLIEKKEDSKTPNRNRLRVCLDHFVSRFFGSSSSHIIASSQSVSCVRTKALKTSVVVVDLSSFAVVRPKARARCFFFFLSSSSSVSDHDDDG